MSAGQVILCLLLIWISLAVCWHVAMSIFRELNGLGGGEAEPPRPNAEERKNERIRKEIEQWRDGK